ncbi:MAG TPA: bifunctional diaminohydroxyphosphoribosylaminopyrimidine deaminase/5-amino-6-(5-phosphoribosylamino)uracil reductase RibD [Ignavibacteriaceae bacterium]|nr:bifunctional diaminohydroxyphosphoribosylaminopyrimidine deaminase/5-amino-6-(5-phosphoribosylamino)uracil reductase RibD [Ignavibacteriaceae bacterium]
MSQQQNDFIKKCFELAVKAAGFVSPNPMVGALLVKQDKIIGEGYHQKYGGAHAEIIAINSATKVLTGSTLYCNLEPCCHTHKQTPPCVPQIIKAGIKKVVISNLDPNPAVSGKGVQQLLNAGIEVITRVSENEGQELNKFYFKFISNAKPYISIKIAQSIDGKITEEKNKQTWLTGEEAQKYVHQQRAIYDAVLVGAETINIDNPELNVRLVDGRNPKRIILDGNLSLNLNSKILKAADIENTWIITCNGIDNEKLFKLKEKGVRILQMPADQLNHISLIKLLDELAKQKISSLFIEGGSNIFSQFITEKLFDELIILQAPVVLGKGLSAISGSVNISLNTIDTVKLGKDIKMTFRKCD